MWPGQVSYLIPVEELYETFHKPHLSVHLGPLMGLMRIISDIYAFCLHYLKSCKPIHGAKNGAHKTQKTA
jgi:hypothetical protein